MILFPHLSNCVNCDIFNDNIRIEIHYINENKCNKSGSDFQQFRFREVHHCCPKQRIASNKKSDVKLVIFILKIFRNRNDPRFEVLSKKKKIGSVVFSGYRIDIHKISQFVFVIMDLKR